MQEIMKRQEIEENIQKNQELKQKVQNIENVAQIGNQAMKFIEGLIQRGIIQKYAFGNLNLLEI